MHGQLQSLGGTPTNPRMVTQQKEVYYRLGIRQLHLTHKTNTRWHMPWMVTYHPYEGDPPTQGWSPTNPRMVSLQKDVYYRQGIWHRDLTHKTDGRWWSLTLKNWFLFLMQTTEKNYAFDVTPLPGVHIWPTAILRLSVRLSHCVNIPNCKCIIKCFLVILKFLEYMRSIKTFCRGIYHGKNLASITLAIVWYNSWGCKTCKL